MADTKEEIRQDSIFSSDSDSSYFGSECVEDEIFGYEPEVIEELKSPLSEEKLKFMVANSVLNPIRAGRSVVSIVVQPTRRIPVGNFGQFSSLPANCTKSENEVDNCVMSLNDLEQYDVMLQGLIDELTAISDDLVSLSLIPQAIHVKSCSHF